MSSTTDKWAIGSPYKSFYDSRGGGLAVATTYPLPWIFCNADLCNGVGFSHAATDPNYSLVLVGGPRFDWYLNLTAASAGARLELQGSDSPTFSVAYTWAMCTDVAAAAGQYSSTQTRTLVPAAGGAATASKDYRSPWPYNRIQFVHGAVAQGAAFMLAVRAGGQ